MPAAIRMYSIVVEYESRRYRGFAATKVAAIALANKIARIAWAMMAKGERYKEPLTHDPELRFLISDIIRFHLMSTQSPSSQLPLKKVSLWAGGASAFEGAASFRPVKTRTPLVMLLPASWHRAYSRSFSEIRTMRAGYGRWPSRQLLEECQNVATLELTTEDDIALRIDAMNRVLK